jgi:hypothetical protein
MRGVPNQRIPDEEVLRYASELGRAVITLNRRDFVHLHRNTNGQHLGIIVCTPDVDPLAQAQRIHDAIEAKGELTSQLVRVIRPPK